MADIDLNSWAVPAKIQTRGVRTWNFQVHWRKNVEIPAIKYKWSGISRVKKKNGSENMWNVLGFGLGISKGCHTICGIFTGEALFFLEFPRVAIYTVKNKNSRGFIKKKRVPRYSNSTNSSLLFRFLDFSWNDSLWYYREVFIMDFPWTVTKN